MPQIYNAHEFITLKVFLHFKKGKGCKKGQKVNIMCEDLQTEISYNDSITVKCIVYSKVYSYYNTSKSVCAYKMFEGEGSHFILILKIYMYNYFKGELQQSFRSALQKLVQSAFMAIKFIII